MVNTAYRYSIELIFSLGYKEYTIPSESIVSSVVNYNYEKLNMPTVYLSLKVEEFMFNKMTKHIEDKDAKVTLIMKRRNASIQNSLFKNYIQQDFSYMMPSDTLYDTKYRILNDEMEDDPEGNRIKYKECTIALIDMDNVDNSKRLYNTIIKNSNMISIIHKFTNHMPMVIEPLDFNDRIGRLIIPPIDTLSELLEYLNNYKIFYKSGYRYFRDFNKTYILSNKGKLIEDEDEFSSILINVNAIGEGDGISIGMDKNNRNKIYQITVNAGNTRLEMQTLNDKMYNSVIGISSDGEIKKVELKTGDDNKQKVLVQRVSNSNMEWVDSIASQMDNGAIILQLSKSELDSAIITPNKEFVVSNYKGYEKYDGRYILVSKTDTYIQQDGEFISSTAMILKKVMD